MILSLFDFDGTITTDDSLIKFIRFAVGDIKAALGLFVLSPMLIAFKLKIIPNYKAKNGCSLTFSRVWMSNSF